MKLLSDDYYSLGLVVYKASQHTVFQDFIQSERAETVYV